MTPSYNDTRHTGPRVPFLRLLNKRRSTGNKDEPVFLPPFLPLAMIWFSHLSNQKAHWLHTLQSRSLQIPFLTPIHRTHIRTSYIKIPSWSVRVRVRVHHAVRKEYESETWASDSTKSIRQTFSSHVGTQADPRPLQSCHAHHRHHRRAWTPYFACLLPTADNILFLSCS